MGSSNADGDEPADIFQEPLGYYPPEKPPQFIEYSLKAGHLLSLRLLGHSPSGCAQLLDYRDPALKQSAKGHLLWNAARIVTVYLEDNAEHLVKGKNVLELGAGADSQALPALSSEAAPLLHPTTQNPGSSRIFATTSTIVRDYQARAMLLLADIVGGPP